MNLNLKLGIVRIFWHPVVKTVMDDPRTLEELKDMGNGRAAPHNVVRLYREAFAAFGPRALWNWRIIEHPTITPALAIADSLRVEGNLEARALAVAIERACRAALTELAGKRQGP